MLPHLAESHVGVLINNSTVGTESKLSAPPDEAKQLPHKALMTVEVQQKELLVCTHTELRGHNVPLEDISANLHKCTKGPSLLGW